MKLFRKVCNSEVKEFSEADLTVVHFISSELPDRGDDILYAAPNEKGAGMIMTGRPVVLQQHGWGEMGQEPIAKPIWIKVSKFKDRSGIECKTQFFPDDLGKRLWKKTSEGYMPNWSVGWRPIEGKVEMKADVNGREVRHVYEWELLEYSIVGVPMQPDAQTGEARPLFVKMISEAEEKVGELVGWKNEEEKWEEKPYPNEHACRLEDPDKYVRVRRQNDKFGKGIHAIWGVQGGGKPVELQAIRLSKDKFTAKEARQWVKDHDYKCKLFEPASEKCEKCGGPMEVRWAGNVDSVNCFATCDLDFVYACRACEEKAAKYECECTKCGHKMDSDEHCRDVKCPKCGGEMRRAERPGPGKDADETCSCDGEADDENICKVCRKPKPEKKPKRMAGETVITLIVRDDIEQITEWLKGHNYEYTIDSDAGFTKRSKQAGSEDEEPPDPLSDEDVGFVMVDADQVRKENGMEDFSHGGHHYVFDFIPEGEIWIDQRMTDEDIMQAKIGLFAERQAMKFFAKGFYGSQAVEFGGICGRLTRHMIDPLAESGGRHDNEDAHWFEHSGNHWHNRGQTVRWDNNREQYIIHSMPLTASFSKEQKEAFEKEIDEAIKRVAVKFGLQEAPPGEPGPGKEKQADNPPEPKRVIVLNSDKERERSEQRRKQQLEEMGRQISSQIDRVLKKVVPEVVHDELDRIRGRVK